MIYSRRCERRALQMNPIKQPPKAVALYGSRGWITQEEAQPIVIVKRGSEFSAADAIVPLWRRTFRATAGMCRLSGQE